MKKLIFSALLFMGFSAIKAQVKETKFGHTISISVPAYFNRTVGLNSAAAIQFKNSVKDVYCILIEDDKEELKLAELTYTDGNEFFEEFYESLMKDEDVKLKAKPTVKKMPNGNNIIYADLIINDKETKSAIYYLVGLAETNGSYYKILSWTGEENKAKYKTDFIKICESLKE